MGIFADVETGWVVVLSTAAGGLITALSGAVLGLLKSRREGLRQARSDALAEWREIVAKLEAQNERRDAVIGQQQRVIETLSEENADCREESAGQRTSLRHFLDTIRRHAAALRALGHDPGPDPELPPARPRREGADSSQFLARQAAQSAAMLTEADKTIRPEGGGP